MRIHTDRQEFGFLPRKFEAEVSRVKISPLPHFDEALPSVIDASNDDGYFYPPPYAIFSVDPKTGKKQEVPRSSRPAPVYHLPPSHKVQISRPIIESDPSVSDEALIVHALAFLFGTRLQFKEWRFEGRVPIKPVNNWSIRDEVAADFLEHTYSWWCKQGPDARVKMINIFYMHTRARSVEWEWDAFAQNYLVSDAVFNLYEQIRGPQRRIRHRDRMKQLCDVFGIAYEQGRITEICERRNELFHEALWAGDLIGMGASTNLHHFLAKLNERLICGVVGYNNKFSKSAWDHLGSMNFDKKI